MNTLTPCRICPNKFKEYFVYFFVHVLTYNLQLITYHSCLLLLCHFYFTVTSWVCWGSWSCSKVHVLLFLLAALCCFYLPSLVSDPRLPSCFVCPSPLWLGSPVLPCLHVEIVLVLHWLVSSRLWTVCLSLHGFCSFFKKIRIEFCLLHYVHFFLLFKFHSDQTSQS